MNLTHLETLLAAATPAPWYVSSPGSPTYYTLQNAEGTILSHIGWGYEGDTCTTLSQENARLAAELRNAAPALIARIKELEKKLENPELLLLARIKELEEEVKIHEDEGDDE